MYELLKTKLERVVGSGITYLKTRVPLPFLLAGSGLFGVLGIAILIGSISGNSSETSVPTREDDLRLQPYTEATIQVRVQETQVAVAAVEKIDDATVQITATAPPTSLASVPTLELATSTAIPVVTIVEPTPLPTVLALEATATPTIHRPTATPLLPTATSTPSPIRPIPTQTPIPTPPGGLIASNQSIMGFMPDGNDIHSFTFNGDPGSWVTIAVSTNSGDLDPFVSVRPPAGSDYSDDNSGGNKNSLIADIEMDSYEVYTISVSGYPGTSGVYTITIQTTESPIGEGFGLSTATPDVGPIIAFGNTVSHQATINYDAAFGDLAITPDGGRVYVTRPFQDDLIAVSTTDLTLLATIPVGGDASAVDFSLDGSLAFVAVNDNPGRVVVIDINPSSSTYHGVIANLECSKRGAHDVKVHDNGDHIFVTHADGHLSSIEMPMPSRIGECIPFASYGIGDLYDLAFSLDGTTGYAAVSPSTTQHVLRFRSRLGQSGFFAPIDLGLNNSLGGAVNLAVSNTGASSTLWVGDNGTAATGGGGGFTVVKMIGNSIVKVKSERFTDTGVNAPDVCITPDGLTAIILVRADSAPHSSIVVYNVASLQQMGSYNDTEDSVYSCAVTPNGTNIFVTMGSGALSKFELR